MDINEIKDQVVKISIIYDIAFLSDPYWLDQYILRSVYKDKPPYKRIEEEDLKEVVNRIGNIYDMIKLSPIVKNKLSRYRFNINIDGKYFDSFDFEEINKVLAPYNYIYFAGFNYGGKPSYLLGRVIDKNKLNDIEEYIIEEIIDSGEIFCMGITHNKKIIGKTKSCELSVWNRIMNLENKSVEKRNLIIEEIKSFFPDYDIEAIVNEPEKFLYEVKKISLKELKKIVIPHERGHIVSEEILPYNDFLRNMNNISSYGSKNLEAFLRALEDSLADTVVRGNIKGTIPSIIDDEDKNGLLPFIIYNIIPSVNSNSNPILKELYKFEFPIVKAFLKYKESGDDSILNCAREEIFEKSYRIAKKVRKASDLEDLRSIKENFDREYKMRKEDVIKDLETYYKSKI